MMLVVDPYYFETFGIKVKEGKAFEPDNILDQRESIILNQAAVDYFGTVWLPKLWVLFWHVYCQLDELLDGSIRSGAALQRLGAGFIR